jgi:Zn-dependent peptidase ImmA (M78 family)
MARVYRRTIGSLLLESPLESVELPTDFRTIRTEQPQLGEECLRAIRDGRRLQSFLGEIREFEPELVPSTNIPTHVRTDDPEVVANRERQSFGISVEQVQRSGGKRQAFNGWRLRLQEAGIVVQVAGFDLKNCRALSLASETGPPVIVVTAKDSYAGRTFSIFHEYGHLLLETSGSCNVGRPGSEQNSIETWCNQFAAAFLMPRSDISLYAQLLPSRDSIITETLLAKISTRYQVSDIAAAIRIDDLNIENSIDKAALFRSEYVPPNPGGGSGATTAELRVRKYGAFVSSSVAQAVAALVVDTATVSETLNVNPSDISEMATFARETIQKHRFA